VNNCGAFGTVSHANLVWQIFVFFWDVMNWINYYVCHIFWGIVGLKVMGFGRLMVDRGEEKIERQSLGNLPSNNSKIFYPELAQRIVQTRTSNYTHEFVPNKANFNSFSCYF
jgi:hypothetical protein